jgi:hypothetical protein
MGLFSRNEALDDVSTDSLKYLLLPIYLGNLVSQLYITDPIARMKQLQRAFELCSRVQFLISWVRHPHFFPNCICAPWLFAPEQPLLLYVLCTMQGTVFFHDFKVVPYMIESEWFWTHWLTKFDGVLFPSEYCHSVIFMTGKCAGLSPFALTTAW